MERTLVWFQKGRRFRCFEENSLEEGLCGEHKTNKKKKERKEMK